MMRGVFLFLFSVMLVRVGIAGSDGWRASSEMGYEDARECISLPLPSNWHAALLSKNEILLQPQEETGSFQSKVIRIKAFEAKNSLFERFMKSADKYMSLICPCTSTFLAYDVMMRRTGEGDQVKIMGFSCTNTESFTQSFVRHIPGKEIDFVVSYRLSNIFKSLPSLPLSYREWQAIITTLRAIHICESDTDMGFLREARETYEWCILKSEAKVVETTQEREELRILVGDEGLLPSGLSLPFTGP